MSVHKLQSGACGNCGAWTGRARMTLCVDCKRASTKRLRIVCAHEGCAEQFDKLGAIKYCVMHRGLRKDGREL
jgi:hypothetical protein